MSTIVRTSKYSPIGLSTYAQSRIVCEPLVEPGALAEFVNDSEHGSLELFGKIKVKVFYWGSQLRGEFRYFYNASGVIELDEVQWEKNRKGWCFTRSELQKGRR